MNYVRPATNRRSGAYLPNLPSRRAATSYKVPWRDRFLAKPRHVSLEQQDRWLRGWLLVAKSSWWV